MSAEEFKNKWKDVILYIELRSDNFNKDLDSLLKEAAQQTKELREENERLKAEIVNLKLACNSLIDNSNISSKLKF